MIHLPVGGMVIRVGCPSSYRSSSIAVAEVKILVSSSLAKKSTPDAFKSLSNILAIELNYIR